MSSETNEIIKKNGFDYTLASLVVFIVSIATTSVAYLDREFMARIGLELETSIVFFFLGFSLTFVSAILAGIGIKKKQMRTLACINLLLSLAAASFLIFTLVVYS